MVRYAGPLSERTVDAWVVESDALNPNGDGVSFIDPTSTDELSVTILGKKVELSKWKEPGNTTFLTAFGAGDISFSAYQHNNVNVFSIHDPLVKVDTSNLSFAVIGCHLVAAYAILADTTECDL